MNRLDRSYPEYLKWVSSSVPDVCRALIRRKRAFSGEEKKTALDFVFSVTSEALWYTSLGPIENDYELCFPVIMDPEASFWSLHCAAETFASRVQLPLIPPRTRPLQILDPSAEEIAISKSHEVWRDTITIGTMVDAWTLRDYPAECKMEPRGWHKCEVKEIDDLRSVFRVLTQGEPPHRLLWLLNDLIVPCGTFSGRIADASYSLRSDANQTMDIVSDTIPLTQEDLQWRNSLHIGSVLDAMDANGVWLRSLVVDVSDEPATLVFDSELGRQMKNLLRISFIGFASSHDQVLGRYSPFICRLNVRSGGKRGAIELPWNIESDEERDMTPYLAPPYSPAQVNDVSIFQKRLCSPFVIQKSDDYFEIFQYFELSITAPGTHIVSQYFCSKLNGAFIEVGYSLPLSFITLWTPMLGKTADLFNNAGIESVLKPFVDCVRRWVQRSTLLWKDDIRNLTKEAIEAILLGMYRISRRWLSKEECGRFVEETIALGIIRQQFLSGVNMKRFEALRLLQDLANMCKNGEEHPSGIKKLSNEEFVRVPVSLYLRSSMLAKWISENSLIRDIFVANQYRELVRLSGSVVLLLSEHQLVKESDIKDIWTSFESTDEPDVECAVDMLSGIISKLDPDTCYQLLNASIKACGTHFSTQTARLLYVFACSQERNEGLVINPERKTDAIVVRSLECLYALSLGIPFSIINMSGTSSSSLVEDVALSSESLRFLTDALRLRRLETFRTSILNSCVRNIAHHVFVMRSINIIKAVMSLYPSSVTTPRFSLPNGSSISPIQQQQQQQERASSLTSPRQGRSKRTLPFSSESNGSSQRVFLSPTAAAAAETAATASESLTEPTPRTEIHEDAILETESATLYHIEMAQKAGIEASHELAKSSLETMKPTIVNSVSRNPSYVNDVVTSAVKIVVAAKSNIQSRGDASSATTYRERTAADVIAELNKTCNLTAVLIRHLLTYCGAGQRVVSDLNLLPAFQSFSSNMSDDSDIVIGDVQGAQAEATSSLDEQEIEILSSDDPSSASDSFPISAITDLQLDPVQLSLNLPTSISRNSPFLRGFHNIFDFLGTTLAENENVFLDATQAMQLWDACVSRAVTEKQRACSILWFVKGAEGLARVTLGSYSKDAEDLQQNGMTADAPSSSSEPSSILLSGFGILFQPETALRIFREKLMSSNMARLDSTLYTAWRTFFLYTAGFRGQVDFFGGVSNLSEVGSLPKDRGGGPVSLDPLTKMSTSFSFPMPPCVINQPKSAIRLINPDPEGMSDLWNIALHTSAALVSKGGSYLLTFLLERVFDKTASVQGAHKQLRRAYVHRCMQEIHSAINPQSAMHPGSLAVEMTIERCVDLLDGIVGESEYETSETFILMRYALAAAMNFDQHVLATSGIAQKIDAACARTRSLLSFASHAPDAYALFETEIGINENAPGFDFRAEMASSYIDPDMSMIVNLKFHDLLLPNISAQPLLSSSSSMDTSGERQTSLSGKVSDHNLYMCSHEKLRDLLVLVSTLTGVPTRLLTLRKLFHPYVLLSDSNLGKTFAELSIGLRDINIRVSSIDSTGKRSIIDDLLALDPSIDAGAGTPLSPSQLLTILETLLERAQNLPAVFLSDDRNNMELFFSYLDSSSSVSSKTSSTVWKFLCRLPTSPVLLELLSLGAKKTIDWNKVFPQSSPSFRLYSSLLLRRLTSPGSKPGLGMCNFVSTLDSLHKTAVSRTNELSSTSNSSVHVHGALLIDGALRRVVRGNDESSTSLPLSLAGMGDEHMAESFKFLFNDFATNGLKRVFSFFSKASSSFPGTIVFKVPESASESLSAASVITYFRILQRFVLSSAIANSTNVVRARFLNQHTDYNELDNVVPDALIHEAKSCLEIDKDVAKSILERSSLHLLQSTVVSILNRHVITEDIMNADESRRGIDPVNSLLGRIGLQTVVSCVFLWSSLCIYDVELWNAQSGSISPLLCRLLHGPKSMFRVSDSLDVINENNIALKLQCAVVSALLSLSSLSQQSSDDSTSVPSSFILDLLISSRPKGSHINGGASTSLYYTLLESLVRDKLVTLQLQRNQPANSSTSTAAALLPMIELPLNLFSLLKDLFLEIKSSDSHLESPLSASAANVALRQIEEANSVLSSMSRAAQKSSMSTTSDTVMSAGDGSSSPILNAKLTSPLSETVSFTRASLRAKLNSHVQRMRPLYSLIPMHRQYLSLGRDPASASCWETKGVLKRAIIEALNSHPGSTALKSPADLFDSPTADAAINGSIIGFGSDAVKNVSIDPELTEETIISSLVGVDHSLIGCFRLAAALVEADPSSSLKLLESEKLDCVQEVYLSLFPKDPPPTLFSPLDHLVEFPTDSGIKWPKVISNATRGAAFNLLLALIRRNSLNTASLLTLLEEKAVQIYDGEESESLQVTRRPPHSGVFEQSPTGYVGIDNLGATCYMNSLLQQLYMIEPIRYGLLSANPDDLEFEVDTDSDKKLLNMRRDESLFYQIQRVMGLLEHSVKASIVPKICAALIGPDNKATNEFEQQDAQEFLMVLFDKLESTLHTTPMSSLISDELRYETSDVKICMGGCKTVRNQPIPGDLNLRLEPRSMDLIKALDDLSKWEEIQGFDCQECQKKTVLMKRSAFTKIGDTLICHLKRFDMNWDTQVISKINTRFEFPRELDLSPYCFDSLSRDPDIIAAGGMTSTSPPRPLEYWQFELVGVVVHTGEYSHGHYYSFIRERGELTKRLKRDYSHPLHAHASSSSQAAQTRQQENVKSQRWFEFNDDRVSDWDPSNLERECFGGASSDNSGADLVSKNAYMLVYERKKSKANTVSIDQNEVNLGKEVLGRDLLSRKVLPRSIATEIMNENIVFSRTLAQTETIAAKFMLAVVDTVSRQPSILPQTFAPSTPPLPILDAATTHAPLLTAATVFRSLFMYFAYPIAEGGNSPIAPHYSYALSRLLGSNKDVALLLADEIITTEKYATTFSEHLFPLSGQLTFNKCETWFRKAIFNNNPVIRYSMSRIFATCLSVLGMSPSILELEGKVRSTVEIHRFGYKRHSAIREDSLSDCEVNKLLDAFFNFKDSTNFSAFLAREKFHVFDAFFAGVYDGLRLGFGSGLPLQFHGDQLQFTAPDQSSAVISAMDKWIQGESNVLLLNSESMELLRLNWDNLTGLLTSPKAASLGITLEVCVSFRLGLMGLSVRRLLSSALFGTAAIFDLFLQPERFNRPIIRYLMKSKFFTPTWTRALDLAALLLKTSYTPNGYGESENIGSPFHTCLGPVRSATHVPSLGLFGKRPSPLLSGSSDVVDIKSALKRRNTQPGHNKSRCALFASVESVMPPFEAFSLTLPEPSSADREMLRNHAIRATTFQDYFNSEVQRFKQSSKIKDSSEAFSFQGIKHPKNCKVSELLVHVTPPADFDFESQLPLTLAFDGKDPTASKSFSNYTQFFLFGDYKLELLRELIGVGTSSWPAQFPDVFGSNIEANVAILGHRLSSCSRSHKLFNEYPTWSLFLDLVRNLVSEARSPDALRASFAVLEPFLMVQDDYKDERMRFTIDILIKKALETATLEAATYLDRCIAFECALEVTRLFILAPDYFSLWNTDKKHMRPMKTNQVYSHHRIRFDLEKFLLTVQNGPARKFLTPAWQFASVLEHWGDLSEDEKEIVSADDIHASMLPGHAMGSVIQSQALVNEIPYRRYLTNFVAGQPVHALSLREEIFCIDEAKMSLSVRAVIARQRLARALRGNHRDDIDMYFCHSTLFPKAYLNDG